MHAYFVVAFKNNAVLKIILLLHKFCISQIQMLSLSLILITLLINFLTCKSLKVIDLIKSNNLYDKV